MDHSKVVSDFIKSLKYALGVGHKDITLSFDEDMTVYPTACVPVAGLIRHYEREGVAFAYSKMPQYLEAAHIERPLTELKQLADISPSPLNKVWEFSNSETVTLLVDALLGEISRVAVCENGVLEGMAWCLSEVMDNVLQHSKSDVGYLMGQIHKSTKHIAFCIFDDGQGIYNSLRTSPHRPRKPVDAITLAIKEGVTRDATIGQGNGMWGLHNIIGANSGQLTITSGSGSYMARGKEIRTFGKIPFISDRYNCTTVDFQIDFEKGICLADALCGRAPVNLRMESMEDSSGNIVYRLADKASGTGTRQSGERIRTEILNIRNESPSIVVLEFSGVAVVSSSFADELIGKLVAEYGFTGFMQTIRLTGMNPTVEAIVNRSVAQRMAQQLQEGSTQGQSSQG